MKLTPDKRDLIYRTLFMIRYKQYIAEKNHDTKLADELMRTHFVVFDIFCNMYHDRFPDIEEVDYKAWSLIEDLKDVNE